MLDNDVRHRNFNFIDPINTQQTADRTLYCYSRMQVDKPLCIFRYSGCRRSGFFHQFMIKSDLADHKCFLSGQMLHGPAEPFFPASSCLHRLLRSNPAGSRLI